MSRIAPVAIDEAHGKAKEMLDELAQRGGEPGPMVRAMAHAPVVLRSYLDLNGAVKRSHLDRRVSEIISLAVHAWLGCEYCLAAHIRAARSLGLSDVDIELAMQATAVDEVVAAIVRFGQQVVADPSGVTDDQVDELRDLGYSDEQILEVVALVALQLLTGAFNLVAGIHEDHTLRSAS